MKKPFLYPNEVCKARGEMPFLEKYVFYVTLFKKRYLAVDFARVTKCTSAASTIASPGASQ